MSEEKKERGVLQVLSDSGINPFAAVLLAESLLKHPKPERIEFFLPIRRSDCAGYSGVTFSLTPIPEETSPEPPTPSP